MSTINIFMTSVFQNRFVFGGNKSVFLRYSTKQNKVRLLMNKLLVLSIDHLNL